MSFSPLGNIQVKKREKEEKRRGGMGKRKWWKNGDATLFVITIFFKVIFFLLSYFPPTHSLTRLGPWLYTSNDNSGHGIVSYNSESLWRYFIFFQLENNALTWSNNCSDNHRLYPQWWSRRCITWKNILFYSHIYRFYFSSHWSTLFLSNSFSLNLRWQNNTQ